MVAKEALNKLEDSIDHFVFDDATVANFIKVVRNYILRLKIDLHQTHVAGGYLNPDLLLQRDARGESPLWIY